MAAVTDLQSASQGLAIGVSMISLFLGLRQWYEGRARWDVADDDRSFYRRQDVRRWLGVVVLSTLAGVVFAASRVRPWEGGKGNIAFVAVWLAVLGLIALTLGVALWDWIATWRFARRKRRALLRDHVEELRHHLRVAAGRSPNSGASGASSAPDDAAD